MKAIILAAGYATRLYPLTKKIPKQLLDIGEKLMIDHLIYIIEHSKMKIEDIYLIVNDTFFKHFHLWNDGKVHIINNGVKNEKNKNGAIKDLYYLIHQLRLEDEDLLILGGDNLFEFSLDKMYNVFKEKGNIIAVRDLGNPELLAKKFGVVEKDKEGKIIGFEEKPKHPKTSLTATLIYMLKKESVKKLIPYISGTNSPDNIGEMIKWLSQNDNVYCFEFKEGWIDIGSFESLNEARRIYSNKIRS